jgi:hypothetical protein
MPTQLSKNFTLEELCVTDTGAANVPGEIQAEKLLYVTNMLLQPIRDQWGRVRVHSGFRSEFVNEKVGGSPASQHMKGEAADIVPLDASIDDVFTWCRQNLVFGQLILESKSRDGADVRWIHVSLPRRGKPNMQAMAFKDGVYKNLS